MKPLRKERRKQWKDDWGTEDFKGENRAERRRVWRNSWNKFK